MIGAAAELAALYDALGPGLYRYALMILADPGAAEDAVHQVFVRVMAAGTQARLIRSPPDYLRRAVRNECMTLLRRRRQAFLDAEAPLLVPAAADASEDERLMIEQALRQLPHEQREAVHLRVYEGLTFQEIADLAHISVNTAASRYRYGIDRLRRALEEKRTRP